MTEIGGEGREGEALSSCAPSGTASRLGNLLAENMALRTLQRVSAHEFKVSQGDTYAAADRAPVLIVKAPGRGARRVVDNSGGTHVLMSVADYRALVAMTTATSVALPRHRASERPGAHAQQSSIPIQEEGTR